MQSFQWIRGWNPMQAATLGTRVGSVVRVVCIKIEPHRFFDGFVSVHGVINSPNMLNNVLNVHALMSIRKHNGVKQGAVLL